jgi:hypothetical protein
VVLYGQQRFLPFLDYPGSVHVSDVDAHDDDCAPMDSREGNRLTLSSGDQYGLSGTGQPFCFQADIILIF